jgi:hypothetical protein
MEYGQKHQTEESWKKGDNLPRKASSGFMHTLSPPSGGEWDAKVPSHSEVPHVQPIIISI